MVKKKVPDKEGVLDEILNLKARGVPDQKIIESLRKKGHNSTDILEGMNQANIKAAVAEPDDDFDLGDDLEEIDIDKLGIGNKSQNRIAAPTAPMPPSPAQFGGGSLSTQDIKDIAETIIEDQFRPFKDELQKVKDWKEEFETVIDKLNDKVESVDAGIASLRAELTQKVKSYGEGLSDAEAEIQAMGEVFRKILPTLSQNVKDLSALAKKLKIK